MQTIRDHAAIARAVAAHEAEAARAAMHRHLSRVARVFQRGVDAEAGRSAAPAPTAKRERPIRQAKARA